MKKVRLAACAVAFTVGGLSPLGVSPAAADTATTGSAAGYGLNAEVAGTSLVNQAGAAIANLPPGQDTGPNALVLLPVAPVAVSGTATGAGCLCCNGDGMRSGTRTSGRNGAPEVGAPDARGVGQDRAVGHDTHHGHVALYFRGGHR